VGTGTDLTLTSWDPPISWPFSTSGMPGSIANRFPLTVGPDYLTGDVQNNSNNTPGEDLLNNGIMSDKHRSNMCLLFVIICQFEVL
jgi:hypothetical protein